MIQQFFAVFSAGYKQKADISHLRYRICNCQRRTSLQAVLVSGEAVSGQFRTGSQNLNVTFCIT